MHIADNHLFWLSKQSKGFYGTGIFCKFIAGKTWGEDLGVKQGTPKRNRLLR